MRGSNFNGVDSAEISCFGVLDQRNIGIMECWNIGSKEIGGARDPLFHSSTIPSFPCRPSLHLVLRRLGEGGYSISQSPFGGEAKAGSQGRDFFTMGNFEGSMATP